MTKLTDTDPLSTIVIIPLVLNQKLSVKNIYKKRKKEEN